MTYETFLEKISAMVQREMGERAKVCLHTIYKNNNVKKDALCILEKGCNVSPTIYLQEYYAKVKAGTSLETVLKEILKEYETNRCGLYLDVDQFRDFDKVKDRIVYKLVNYEQNRELLKDVPHRRFLDLAVVYYLLIENHFIGSGTAMIHHQQRKMWQVEEPELYTLASCNTDRLLGNEILPMRQVILKLLKLDLRHQLAMNLDEGLCGEEQVDQWAEQIMDNLLPEQKYTMYVMSNQNKYLGAAAVLNGRQLRQFVQKLNCGVYVIPSSIHEVILMPETEPLSRGDMERLLTDINETEDNAQEFLSGRIYYFDREKGLQVL